MHLKKKIIPAIIAQDQNELNERLSKVVSYVDIVQLDIMDNIFVPNTSLFFDFTLPRTSCQFEAHLMVQDPEAWIARYGKKVDTVLVHVESEYDSESVVKRVKKHGKRFGYVLNPETPGYSR